MYVCMSLFTNLSGVTRSYTHQRPEVQWHTEVQNASLSKGHVQMTQETSKMPEMQKLRWTSEISCKVFEYTPIHKTLEMCV